MPNPATALQTLTPLVEQRTVVDGFVSAVQPAPVSFEDQLFVIVPEHSPDVPFGPCEWGAIHGGTLPAQGAKVVIVFDEREVPVVVWWEGAHTEPPEPETVGPWTPVTLGAKVESNGTFQTVECRLEQNGKCVRLRGAPAVKAGQTLTAGETLCTLPSGFRPPVEVALSAITSHSSGTPTLLEISTAGVVTCVGELTTTVFVPFDSITFNL